MVTVDPTRIVVDGEYADIPVEQPWRIVPDSTSVYSFFLPMEGITVLNNKAVDAAKSILLFSPHPM